MFQKRIDSKPVCNTKYLKPKIKSNWKMNINFHNNKISKEDSQYTGLSIVLHDSVLRTAKNYYLKCF